MTHPPTILIVECEQPILAVLTDILTCAATTGRDGIAVLVSERPSLTMFDMALPDVEAAEFIRTMGALGLTATRLVLMSTSPQRAAPLLVPGEIECLGMPFDLDPFVRMVARLAGAQPAAPAMTMAIPPRMGGRMGAPGGRAPLTVGANGVAHG